MKIDTMCVQGGYLPKCGEPRQVPIYAVLSCGIFYVWTLAISSHHTKR